jgi:hypothetical protein
MMFRQMCFSIVLVVLVLTLAACGAGTAPTVVPETAPPEAATATVKLPATATATVKLPATAEATTAPSLVPLYEDDFRTDQLYRQPNVEVKGLVIDTKEQILYPKEYNKEGELIFTFVRETAPFSSFLIRYRATVIYSGNRVQVYVGEGDQWHLVSSAEQDKGPNYDYTVDVSDIVSGRKKVTVKFVLYTDKSTSVTPWDARLQSVLFSGNS